MRVFTFVMLLSGALLFAPLQASAQDPPPVPDPLEDPDQDTENGTQARREFFHVDFEVIGDSAMRFDWTETGKSLQFKLSDRSDVAQATATNGVDIECTFEPLTETGNWNAQLTSRCPAFLLPGQEKTRGIQVSRTMVPGPVTASWALNVTMVAPVQEKIANLIVTAWVDEFSSLGIRAAVPPTASPGEAFNIPLTLTNNGNQVGIFHGEVSAPEGWHVVIPETVAVPTEEALVINASVLAPRGKIYYMSESSLIQITYTNADNRAITQTRSIPVTVDGVFLPPQLVPFVLLSLGLIGVFLFFGVLARRTVEEQILGKPIPPWRIPVERQYLERLAREDPDEYYVVRYYLMEEEHRSALLWYHAYKHATKKDRKTESKWVKLKSKQERKIRGEEKAHLRLQNRWDRKVLRMEKRRDRKVRRLEKKLRRKERKKQKRFDKKYDKIVAKIQKKHDKMVDKAVKKHDKKVAKETKKIERKNRKLEKKGEEPLPLPETPAPEFPEPDLPERKVASEVPLEESRYAKRAERIRRYYGWRAGRRRKKGDQRVAKDARRLGLKVEKLRANIPPEPKTSLYAGQEYLDEDEIVVEDDRSLLAKVLHLPTLEEREQDRRRQQVYHARIRHAKAEKDPSKVASLKLAQREERRSRRDARRQEVALARANLLEHKRLEKERKRQIKQRTRELAREAKEAGRGGRTHEESAPSALAPPQTPEAQALSRPIKAEVRTSGGGPHKGETGKRRFKVPFRKQTQAGAEEDKKGEAESPEAATGGKEQ